MSTTEREHLHARRDLLALRLAEGEPVEPELEKLELEIFANQEVEGLTAERQAAAARARATREQAETERLEHERCQQLEGEMRALAEERGRLADEIEQDLVKLKAHIDALLTIGTKMYAVSSSLGTPRRRLQLDGVVGARVSAVLWPFAGSRPDVSLRKPLPELLVPLPVSDGPAG